MGRRGLASRPERSGQARVPPPPEAELESPLTLHLREIVVLVRGFALLGDCPGASGRTGPRNLLLPELAPDHLQREKVLPLLTEDPAEPLDVLVIELAVARRRPLGVEQTLALQKSNLGDGDVGELLFEEGQDFSDGEVVPLARFGQLQPPEADRKTSLYLPI